MTTRSRGGRRREPGGPPKRAKLFWNGRSQAVRLPREFRFDGTEVAVHRDGDRVILEPIRRRTWPKGYWERLRDLSRYFADFEVPEPLPPGGAETDLDAR